MASAFPAQRQQTSNPFDFSDKIREYAALKQYIGQQRAAEQEAEVEARQTDFENRMAEAKLLKDAAAMRMDVIKTGVDLAKTGRYEDANQLMAQNEIKTTFTPGEELTSMTFQTGNPDMPVMEAKGRAEDLGGAIQDLRSLISNNVNPQDATLQVMQSRKGALTFSPVKDPYASESPTTNIDLGGLLGGEVTGDLGTPENTEKTFLTEQDLTRGTGPISNLKQSVGNVFGWMVPGQPFADTAQSRSKIRMFNQSAKDALVNNRRFPVAEVQTVQAFLPDPDKIFRDPDQAKIEIQNMKEFLENKRESALAKLKTAQNKSTIDDYLDQLIGINSVLGQLPSFDDKGEVTFSPENIFSMPDDIFKTNVQQLSREDLQKLPEETLQAIVKRQKMMKGGLNEQ